jgi:hypothetical protein
MAFKSKVVSVTSSATLLSDDQVDSVSGFSIAVAVPSAGTTIYVGGSDVTAANGFPIAATEKFSTGADPGEKLYGITASGTQSVNVFEQGL